MTDGVGRSEANCHSGGAGQLATAGSPIVALVGAPNVGKSTLFNALTGSHRDVGNWPGTSVEVGRGAWIDHGFEFDLIDLPGAYSLDPISPDEALTRDLIAGAVAGRHPDVVVVVADSARLARSLTMVVQLLDSGQRVVVALTMADVAHRRGITVDEHGLEEALGVPVLAMDPRRRAGLHALADAVHEALGREASPVERPASEDALARSDRQFTRVADAVSRSVMRADVERRSWSDRIDRIALAPVLGPAAFLIVMWLVFQLTTTIAAPLQSALDWVFTVPVTNAVDAVLATVGLADSWVRGLLVDGLVAGVGMLLTFVPLMAIMFVLLALPESSSSASRTNMMAIMFVLLALLEDSGYMARAAVVTDRMMRRIGLPGRAFLPLIVGFGCNVPAIAATRVLPDARHRMLTTLLVPFTSCSARLTVYVMVATIFFPSHAGTVVFVMYVISILFVVIVGILLRQTLWRTMGDEPLILDLPPYQQPTVRLTAVVAWMRLRGFLRTASGIIVATVVAVWLLQSIPIGGQGSFARVPVQDSLYAAAASAVAPVFTPAGFGTWETTSALMVGFVAKEAVISSWSQTYATAEPDRADTPGSLGDLVRADFAASSSGHERAAAWSFLIFLLAYTPCVATLTAQRREIGTRWTLFGVGMQLVVAWLVAVAVFQIGSRLG